jgi:hypothetical protein
MTKKEITIIIFTGFTTYLFGFLSARTEEWYKNRKMTKKVKKGKKGKK